MAFSKKRICKGRSRLIRRRSVLPLGNYSPASYPPNFSDSTNSMTITVPQTGTVSNVILSISFSTHGYNSILIESPIGTRLTMISNLLGTVGGGFIFDDNGGPIPPSDPTPSGTYSPNQLLSGFDGESVNGDWIVEVTDNTTLNGGGPGTTITNVTLNIDF